MRSLVKLAAMTLALIGSASAAHAVNLALTGTWTGTATCKKTSNSTGVVTKGAKEPVTIQITQSGSDLNVQISNSTEIGLNSLKYNGFGYANPDKPNNGLPFLMYCGSSSSINANVTFTAKTDPSVPSGKLKGEMLGLDSVNIYRCKYKVELTDSTNPAITTCP